MVQLYLHYEDFPGGWALQSKFHSWREHLSPISTKPTSSFGFFDSTSLVSKQTHVDIGESWEMLWGHRLQNLKVRFLKRFVDSISVVANPGRSTLLFSSSEDNCSSTIGRSCYCFSSMQSDLELSNIHIIIVPTVCLKEQTCSSKITVTMYVIAYP